MPQPLPNGRYTTVLGGDDKSGCAVIIEVIRCLQEHLHANGRREQAHACHDSDF